MPGTMMHDRSPLVNKKFHHSSTIVLDYNTIMVYVIAPNGTASRTPTTETSTACAH